MRLNKFAVRSLLLATSFIAATSLSAWGGSPNKVSAPYSASSGFERCQESFPSNYRAQNLEGTKQLCFNEFAVLYSGATKTPVFSVEHLTSDRLRDAKGEERTNKFYEEARLPSAMRSILSDYHGSGYDRGHNAPAGDMPDAQSMAQSFSLANMFPQLPNHNRKTWNKIEQDTRKYVLRRIQDDIFVFTGPFFSPAHKVIGNNVWVPDAIWKVVYNKTSGEIFVHWSEHVDNAQIEKPISYQEFERRSGLHLLN